MFRKNVISTKTQAADRITWRGHEITRIEAFSDAVFGFAVTLLIMSLEVPRTSEELMKTLHFILPFGICFGITMTIWYNQNLYFRRFGLHDFTTIFLNGILMFLVLVYMFPLKFLIGSAMTHEFRFDTKEQIIRIYCLYSGGFACFYFLFSMMYLNAYSKREYLKLSPAEAFSTMTSVYGYLIVTAVSILSVCVALQGYIYMNFAGFIYILIGPAMSIYHSKRKKLLKAHFSEPVMQVAVLPASETLETIPDDKAN